MKSLGWDRWRAGWDAALDKVRTEGECAAVRSGDFCPTTGAQGRATAVGRRRGRAACGAPVVPTPVPVIGSDDEACVRWATTNLRQQKQPGCGGAIATVRST
jgi:hypothetical protein